MLMIEDNVDLKELEKYGFKGESYQNGFIYRNCYVYRNALQQPVIFIDLKLRVIEMGFDFAKTDDGIDVIFELIQAGLVKKVGKYEMNKTCMEEQI